MTLEIRKVVASDISDLKIVLDSSNLFPSEFLDGMISEYLNDPNTEEIWFTGINDGIAVALGYCVPEKLTDGTYNLLAIAVKGELQRNGVGKKMMTFVENLLVQNGKRLLIVETSSEDHYELARNFYEKIGYTREATVRDFWKEGDSKIIYRKKLTSK
ncbi:MAG: N-acetyltransferase [Bacteroidia bacterium]|nr:N-acetyltransferase [Bacteroidia bacterium]